MMSTIPFPSHPARPPGPTTCPIAKASKSEAPQAVYQKTSQVSHVKVIPQANLPPREQSFDYRTKEIDSQGVRVRGHLEAPPLHITSAKELLCQFLQYFRQLCGRACKAEEPLFFFIGWARSMESLSRAQINRASKEGSICFYSPERYVGVFSKVVVGCLGSVLSNKLEPCH